VRRTGPEAEGYGAGNRIRIVVEAGEGKRRVLLFQRQNGTWGFAVERLSEDPLEGSRVPDGRYSEAFFDSEETALAEARGRVPWLTELQQNPLLNGGPK
jgi:hypothetical protein